MHPCLLFAVCCFDGFRCLLVVVHSLVVTIVAATMLARARAGRARCCFAAFYCPSSSPIIYRSPAFVVPFRPYIDHSSSYNGSVVVALTLTCFGDVLCSILYAIIKIFICLFLLASRSRGDGDVVVGVLRGLVVVVAPFPPCPYDLYLRSRPACKSHIPYSRSPL